MRGIFFSLGALALGFASACEYPDCEQDGCYRNLIDDRFYAEAKTFCPMLLAGTTTAASAIPSDFGGCLGDINAVSSACSCVTYTMTATGSTTSSTTSQSSTVTTPTSVPAITTPASSTPTPTSSVSSAPPISTTSSTSSSPESTTSEPASSSTSSSSSSSSISSSSLISSSSTVSSSSSTSSAPGTASVPLSTSTFLSTTIYTVTSCAASVTNCPAKGSLTTETIVLSTSVNSVTGTTPPISIGTSIVYSSGGLSTYTYPTGSGTGGKGGPTPTNPGNLQVTAAAGRVAIGFEMAVAAAGMAVVFL